MTDRCDWCQTEFEPKDKKRFCSSKCRLDFHRAQKVYTERLLDAGLLTMDALRLAVYGGENGGKTG